MRHGSVAMDGMNAPEHADRTVAGSLAARRPGGVRQPSLLELMSLQDFRRFVPETLGLLLAIVLVRGVLDTSLPSASDPHHAFWIPVLLMAAQYGIMGGLFAAGSTSLLVLATELPGRSAAQDFYDYAAFAAAQPCAWFVAALVLGGLRTLHMHNQARLEDRLEETRATAEELADWLVESGRGMALLEQRIAADTATTAVLLDAFAQIDLSSREALLASFASIVRQGAGAESFAIFLREGENLVPRLGFENGSQIPRAALASLPPLPPIGAGRDESRTSTAQDATAGLPIQLPIRVSDAAEPIGCLVCTRIAPAQTPTIVARRLNEVCCVLAKLLLAPNNAFPETARRPGSA